MAEVFFGEYEPIGPNPALVGSADADVEDEPVEATWSDVRVAKGVGLPGTGDSEILGLEGEISFVDLEVE